MTQISPGLIVGDEHQCQRGHEQLAVVHACKSPCHQGAVGYRGSLPATHPNYLIQERPFDLFMNLIDPPRPLFKAESFDAFLRFAAKHRSDGRSILIHCNKGESRAPSLSLLLLAAEGTLPSGSYREARAEFEKLYPSYRPGRGIETFVTKQWSSIVT